MKLLQTIINEGGMKDAAMDLIDQAANAVPKVDNKDKYLMAVVAKVLELDTHKIFRGDFKAVEDMVKVQLGEAVVAEGEVIPFPTKKAGGKPPAPPAAKKAAENGVLKKAKDKDYPLTEKGLNQLIRDLNDDAADGPEEALFRDARFKDVSVDWPLEIEWVTQATNAPGRSKDAAKAIAKVLKLAGFTGMTVKVVVRDEWGDRKTTPWQKAKS